MEEVCYRFTGEHHGYENRKLQVRDVRSDSELQVRGLTGSKIEVGLSCSKIRTLISLMMTFQLRLLWIFRPLCYIIDHDTIVRNLKIEIDRFVIASLCPCYILDYILDTPCYIIDAMRSDVIRSFIYYTQ